ncbi:hypothetical protein ACFL3V_06245 [Nanoarchaeota archaeon]
MKRKIVQRIKGSLLFDTCRRSSANKMVFFLAMLSEACFFGSLFLLNILFSRMFPDPQSLILNPNNMVAIVLLQLVAWFGIIVLLYSFFKFLVIDQIRKIFAKGKLDWGQFSRFLVANYALTAIFLAVFVVISAALIVSVRVKLLVNIRNVFFVLAAVCFYLTMNTAHSLYFQGKGMRLVRRSIGVVFNRLRLYFGPVLSAVAMFFVFAAVYYAFDWIVLWLLGSAMQNPVVYGGYAVVNTLVLAVFMLVLLAFNRAYIYNVLKGAKSL